VIRRQRKRLSARAGARATGKKGIPVPNDAFVNGPAYERYMERWSRPAAAEFLRRLRPLIGARWLDVGCGTGVLTRAALELAGPGAVVGLDRSEALIAYAREHVDDPRARFQTGDASDLGFDTGAFDLVVSGLVLNFLPEPLRAVREMARVTRFGGTVAGYVWDYAGRMDLVRCFWDAAVALDPAAETLDEGRRFPLRDAQALTDLFAAAGLRDIEAWPIQVRTVFLDFDEFWSPFLGGVGPAPAYAMSLDERSRTRLRDRIRASLPIGEDGLIRLMASAWAVSGRR